MNLKVVRGPLGSRQNEVILRHYNRLSSSCIPMREYLRWVQEGPEGPGWHVLLENDASEIVGHSLIIPIRARFDGRQIIAGKSEYSFILEEYRSAKIRGFENLAKPRNAIMVQQLFQRWQAEGLGPLLISTSSLRQRTLGLVGCAAASFPVSECLLVLRPWSAAKMTPNLQRWQRASLWTAGILQRAGWSFAKMLWRRPKEIHKVPVGEGACTGESGEGKGLRFFDDVAALRWRYPEEQYEQLALEGKKGEYLIVKKGSADRYLRVCQWQLGAGQPTPQVVGKMVEMAKKEKALGVRWAVYGDSKAANDLALRIRRFGFLCARRTRTLLVFSKEQEFLSADNWNLTDAMFSFDP